MHWDVSGERRIIAVDGDSADAQEGRPNRVDVFCATASQGVEEFLQQRNFLSKTPLKVMPPLYQTTQFQATPRLYQSTRFKSTPSLYQIIQLQFTPPLYQTIQLKATPPLYQTTPFKATPPLYQTTQLKATPSLYQNIRLLDIVWWLARVTRGIISHIKHPPTHLSIQNITYPPNTPTYPAG